MLICCEESSGLKIEMSFTVNQQLVREIFNDFETPFPVFLVGEEQFALLLKAIGMRKKLPKKNVLAEYYPFLNCIVLYRLDCRKGQVLEDVLRGTVIHELRHWQQYRGRLRWIYGLSVALETLLYLSCAALSFLAFLFGLYWLALFVFLWASVALGSLLVGFSFGRCGRHRIVEFDAKRYECKTRSNPCWKKAIPVVMLSSSK